MNDARPARDCDPMVARAVLRGYLGAMGRNERRTLLRRTLLPQGGDVLTVPLTRDDGAIVYSRWEALALAGDLF